MYRAPSTEVWSFLTPAPVLGAVTPPPLGKATLNSEPGRSGAGKGQDTQEFFFALSTLCIWQWRKKGSGLEETPTEWSQHSQRPPPMNSRAVRAANALEGACGSSTQLLTHLLQRCFAGEEKKLCCSSAECWI